MNAALNPLRDQMRQLEEYIDAKELRERALLLVAGAVLMYFIFDTLALQPAYRQQQQTQFEITEWEQQLGVLQQRSGLLDGSTGIEPAEQRAQLRRELDELERRVQDKLGALLEPEQAVELLKQVLAQEQDLQLIEVTAESRALTGTELDTNDSPADPEAGSDAQVAGIGRYQMQLELEGSYMATLRYLEALESLPWKFYWEGVELEVTEHPKARVTLDIYTLGLLER